MKQKTNQTLFVGSLDDVSADRRDGIGNGGFPSAEDEILREGMAKGQFQSHERDVPTGKHIPTASSKLLPSLKVWFTWSDSIGWR